MPRSARRRAAPPRVLHAAAELFPWVKTGGLGDVMAALPPALLAVGVDARLVVPGYPALLDSLPMTEVARFHSPFALERVRVCLTRLPDSGARMYVIDHAAFYDRPGSAYADPGGHDWGDNHRRFALLGWTAAALATGGDPAWRPDVVHGHDWHAGLAPAYLKAWGAPTPSIFTIHNLAYQGFFWGGAFADLALPPDYFSMYGVEYHGGVSFLKAGLFYADRLTTVSPTYAEEIQTAGYGMNLDGLLRDRAAVLRGILNGVDATIWSPEQDHILPQPYGAEDATAGKAAAKAALQRRLGLAEDPDAPLFGAVTRLTWQKGMDLVLGAVPGLVGMGGQLALLGSGEWDLESGFSGAVGAHPGRVGVYLGYDEDLSHLIIAGCDCVLVPSRFEPCGLTQLYGLRYGTLPVVRRTGGLADTVVDANAVTLADGSATGFVFEHGFADDVLGAVQRAVALYPEKASWQRVMQQAMTRDFSWEASARQYLGLYRELVPAA